jgi:cytochrome P450
VEETLRFMPTAGGQPRLIAEDLVHNGVLIPAGTLLFTNFLGSNFDPAVWDEPTAFDPDKAGPTQGHLTFGTGTHVCLGAWLARAELQEAVRAIVTRMSGIRLDGPIRWKPYTSRGMWGLDQLNVTFDAQ